MTKSNFFTKDVMKIKITPLETLINQYEIPVDYDLNRFSRNGIHELTIDANFEFKLDGEISPKAEELAGRVSPNCNSFDECYEKVNDFLNSSMISPNQELIDKCISFIKSPITILNKVGKEEVDSAYYRATCTCDDCKGNGDVQCPVCKGHGDILRVKTQRITVRDRNGGFVRDDYINKRVYLDCSCNNGYIGCNRCSSTGEVTRQVETKIYLIPNKTKVSWDTPKGAFDWMDKTSINYSDEQLINLADFSNNSSDNIEQTGSNTWFRKVKGQLNLTSETITITPPTGDPLRKEVKFIGSSPYDLDYIFDDYVEYASEYNSKKVNFNIEKILPLFETKLAEDVLSPLSFNKLQNNTINKAKLLSNKAETSLKDSFNKLVTQQKTERNKLSFKDLFAGSFGVFVPIICVLFLLDLFSDHQNPWRDLGLIRTFELLAQVGGKLFDLISNLKILSLFGIMLVSLPMSLIFVSWGSSLKSQKATGSYKSLIYILTLPLALVFTRQLEPLFTSLTFNFTSTSFLSLPFFYIYVISAIFGIGLARSIKYDDVKDSASKYGSTALLNALK
ncbi:hypothetical protein ACOYR1_05965 [Thalassotalea piscium]